MIRNKLSDLLGQRQMKISKLSFLTGIARSTLTPIYSNHSEMIRIETINKICKALNINVIEFFESVNFDINFHIDNDENENILPFVTSDTNGITNYNINVSTICEINDIQSKHFLDIKFEVAEGTSLSDIAYDVGKGDEVIWEYISSNIVYKMSFDNKEDEELFNNYIDQLSVGMKVVLNNRIIDFLRKFLVDSFKDDSSNMKLNTPKMLYKDLFKYSNIEIENF